EGLRRGRHRPRRRHAHLRLLRHEEPEQEWLLVSCPTAVEDVPQDRASQRSSSSDRRSRCCPVDRYGPAARRRTHNYLLQSRERIYRFYRTETAASLRARTGGRFRVKQSDGRFVCKRKYRLSNLPRRRRFHPDRCHQVVTAGLRQNRMVCRVQYSDLRREIQPEASWQAVMMVISVS